VREYPAVRILLYLLLQLTNVSLIVAQVAAGRPFVDIAIALVAVCIYAAVGGLVVFRHNGHLTGWLLCLVGLAVVLADGTGSLSFLSETANRWLGSWIWTSVFALFGLLTLTFPSGRSPDGVGLWPRLGRMAVVALPLLVAAAALTETLGGPEASVPTDNPIGFIPSWLSGPILAALAFTLLAGSISLVVKRRRSSGVERAQLTWVVFPLALFATAVVLTLCYLSLAVALGGENPGDEAWTVVYVMMVVYPIWFGVAVLRYRLFEIDRIISRTVSYALVVAVLAGTFVLMVTLVTALLPANSDVAVAASTLVVAALFNPLRSRVQRAVDRRFNRSHYDAMLVGTAFAELMRDEADLERIVSEWIDVVSVTLHPTAASVWIRLPSSTVSGVGERGLHRLR
jgi:hypothetical protein